MSYEARHLKLTDLRPAKILYIFKNFVSCTASLMRPYMNGSESNVIMRWNASLAQDGRFSLHGIVQTKILT